MQIAALQFDVQRATGSPSAVAANLSAARSAVEEAALGGARLVVLPEVWATSFPTADPACDSDLAGAAAEAMESAAKWSREFGLVIAGSFLSAAPALGEKGAGRFFNRLLVHDGAAGGEVVLSYDKLHLFSPTAEHEVFAPGGQLPAIVDCSVGRISGAICYDLRFPEVFAPMRRAEVDLLVVPAQWASRRSSHWRALVLGRAVEGQFFVAASNRTGSDRLGSGDRIVEFSGNSILAAPSGEVLGEGRGEVGAVFGTFDSEVARVQRIRVPVDKDRRDEIFGPG
jgi:predicted amidohydrolase